MASLLDHPRINPGSIRSCKPPLGASRGSHFSQRLQLLGCSTGAAQVSVPCSSALIAKGHACFPFSAPELSKRPRSTSIRMATLDLLVPAS